MADLFDKINTPADLKQLSVDQLKQLAGEMREYITQSVSQTGGHLASNLGVIELTIAMHYVFDFKTDKLFWDVGHQCYAHKILTGRKTRFPQLRQEGGLSGFPSPAESPYDQFFVGHAGTSIATALGMAIGSRHSGSDEKIVAFVGDASIVNGTSFEALNNLGLAGRQLLVVLNDNSMAIDVTQGSMAKFLSRVRLSHTYEDIRKTTTNILEHLPLIGKKMDNAIENFKKTIRMQISPSRLFESLNIPYFGPVDGHDIGSLIQLFKAIEHLDEPAILHVYTKKGKGFTPADANPRKFHSTGPFEIYGNSTVSGKPKRKYTEAFGDILLELAGENDKLVAITAAMPDGTGLVKFREKYPDRCYDVGIAETVAIDIAAGMAKKNLRPIVCIYSTFLQRAYDHIFQEVALQNLPVIFCIDRAGLVGNDGPTHHGLTDMGFLRMLPGMVLMSPACESEIKSAMRLALSMDQPSAIRYPKDIVANGRIQAVADDLPFELGKSITIQSGNSDVVLAALGNMTANAIEAADILARNGIDATVINARFAKPVDNTIIDLAASGKKIFTMEDHCLAGGFGAAVLEKAALANVPAGTVVPLALPDKFIPAGTRKWQMESNALGSESIAQKIISVVKN